MSVNEIGAGIILVGGLIGFMTAGSIPSLVSSSIFSVVMFLVSRQMDSSIDKNWLYLACGLWVVLMVMMGIRFARTQKAVPGVVAVVSLVFALYNLNLIIK